MMMMSFSFTDHGVAGDVAKSQPTWAQETERAACRQETERSAYLGAGLDSDIVRARGATTRTLEALVGRVCDLRPSEFREALLDPLFLPSDQQRPQEHHKTIQERQSFVLSPHGTE